MGGRTRHSKRNVHKSVDCLLYTSDAADDLLCVDLGGRRIIKKKKQIQTRPNVPTSIHIYRLNHPYEHTLKS